MNSQQRKFVADKLGTLGNFAIVAMVFGQLVNKEPIHYNVFYLGVICWLVLMFLGYLLLRGEE